MTSNEDDDNFHRMQHLISEMDRSNQRINLFNEKLDVERPSTEAAFTRPSPLEKQFGALLDEDGRSEESDGASPQGIPVNNCPKDSDDSGCEEVINSAIAEVSKDFLAGLQTSGTQNHYGDSDESRISSDNDFKLVCGMPSYARYPETAAGLSDTDWNPYGTESDSNHSPHLQSAQSLTKEPKAKAYTPFQPILHSTGFNATTPNTGDKILSVNSHSGLSDIREDTEKSRLLSQVLKPDIMDITTGITWKADWALTPKIRVRKPNNASPEDFTRKAKGEETSPKNSGSSDEEKKMIASTSSTGYSSATSGVKINGEVNGHKSVQDPQHMSVFERAKLIGVPEDILFDKSSPTKKRILNEKTNSFGLSDYDSDDHLGHKVQHILSETAYLNGGSVKANFNKAAVDYNLLQKDLQEIQDNLESLSSGSPRDRVQDWKNQTSDSPFSSDKEGDIPSTGSTPDRNRNNPVWDFADIIGSLPNRMQTNGVHSHRSVSKKGRLNSDGDETRSSDSSHKSEDHVALSESFQPNLRDLDTSRDVDQMLSTFRDQRHQLESRYQQLNNQGLAEKVFRILTNQDPESQANGILSEVSADEKEMKANLAMKQHYRDFNFSSNSSLMENSGRSLGLPDDVRKKLDLSGISSVDSSRLLDKSSFNMPTSTRGFSAFDDAKRFLSSQMAKVSERTFNHSIEMRYPQSIHCYPLLMDKTDKEDRERHKDEEDSDSAKAEEISAVNLRREDGSSQPLKDKSGSPLQDLFDKEKHESPTSADLGSTSRPKEKYRPYRPPGSKEVYYTESDTASVADSVTTMESTHLGSDDAAGPHLPLSAYGSRKETPNVAGIYGTRKNLSIVQEATEPSSVDDQSQKDDKGSKSSKESTGDSSSSLKQPRISPQQEDSNGRSGPGVTTQRYNTSIWAKRDDFSNRTSTEKKEEKLNQRPTTDLLTHGEPISPSHSVSSARRNAQWANRVDDKRWDLSDINKRSSERDRPFESISSERPSRLNGRDFLDTAEENQDRTSIKQEFTLPSNAFVSEGQNEREGEPMSLRIKLAYTDTHRGREGSPQRDALLEKYDRTRSRFGHDDADFRTSERSRFQPQESYMHSQNLVRSASDENLNSSQRDARLSPAFRRALSPELLSSIGTRSPLLGRNIERSLAQPPSDYPSPSRTKYSSSHADQRPYRVNDPPTFLARERAYSPREFVTSPTSERLNQVSPSMRNPSFPPQDVFTLRDRRSRTLQTSSNRRQHTPEKKQDGGDRLGLRPSSPLSSSKSKQGVELTLAGMSSESEVDAEIDTEPMSKRAQLLKDALSHEREPNINPDINAMWEQFKSYNESDDSSVNTARMEAVADLLKKPSAHFVSQYLKEREEYRINRQERVEQEREKRMKEQAKTHKSSSSEDEVNERYRELLVAKEEERLRRRSVKKKKSKHGDDSKAPDVIRSEQKYDEKLADSLYSIPEDRSFDRSPSKTSFSRKNKAPVSSQPNLIDPKMLKLREKISNQKKKVDKEMMKEMIKIEKLKKLEQLLKAKRNGEITNQMLEQQLEELSSTSHNISDNSLENFKSTEPNSGFLSDDSTTAKDSSGEMQMWKMKKENRYKDLDLPSKQGDKLGVKNYNNNKENKPRHESNHSLKEMTQHSEIKLLKLVKEGYLTAEEAYKLALARKEKKGSHPAQDISTVSSENDSSINANRFHKFYSPYSRAPASVSHLRHIPKLKFSDRLDDNSSYGRDYWKGSVQSRDHEEFKSESRPSRRTGKDAKFTVSQPVNYKQDRGRPRSQSPFDGLKYKIAGQRKNASSRSQSPLRAHSTSPIRRANDVSRFPSKEKHGKRYPAENNSLKKKGFNRGIAWHVDMNGSPDQWKEPRTLQEIPSSTLNKPTANRYLSFNSNINNKDSTEYRKHPATEQSIWQKPRHPQGIPKLQWEEVVSRDALASKTNHWEVDPIMDRVQYILNKPSSNTISDQTGVSRRRDVDCSKSSSKLSLQEAFLHRKQNFISKCRERQKRLALSKEDRQMQECLRLEREAIFAEQERMGPANIYAHPYSDNLYQPKRRVLTRQEMKDMTARKYKNLPEVIVKKEENRKKIENRLNRLRANLFNKKVQKEVLKKRYKPRG